NVLIIYTDSIGVLVFTVTYVCSGMSTVRISFPTRRSSDLAGNDLTIGQAIALGTGNLTLVDTGNVTQGATGVITAAGLQLMGSGSANLDNSTTDIRTLGATFNGSISYTDASALTVGTVTDG